MDVLELAHVRASCAIRESGIDPHADPRAAREVIAAAIAAMGEDLAGSAGGSESVDLIESGRSIEVPEALRPLLAEVSARLSGHGPIQEYLDDPTVEEIWINSPGRVFVARNGRSELTSTVLSAETVRDLVERLLSASGRRIDVSTPFVDAALRDGSRLHVVIPDVTRRHWAVNIRKFVVKARGIEDLVAPGMLTAEAGSFLRSAVVEGRNLVVAGGTQAGKTTLLNALLGSVPASERLITCEETFELSVPDHPDWVAMQTRQAGLEGTGEVTLRHLVREALRMRPTRIVVGEVRQQEALELMVAMNSGMPAMATIHANSAREAVTKLCTLPLLAGTNISADFVRPTVAACVDVVVHLRMEPGGRRAVSEIATVPGQIDGQVIAMEPVFVTRDGVLTPTDGHSRSAIPGAVRWER